MNSIKNDSFDIIVSKKESIVYQIAKKNPVTGIITLFLSFKNSSKISSGSEPDILEVILNEYIEFKIANKIFIFKNGLRSSRTIPPLL